MLLLYFRHSISVSGSVNKIKFISLANTLHLRKLKPHTHTDTHSHDKHCKIPNWRREKKVFEIQHTRRIEILFFLSSSSHCCCLCCYCFVFRWWQARSNRRKAKKKRTKLNKFEMILFFQRRKQRFGFFMGTWYEREKTAIKLNERGINEQKKERIFLLLVSSFLFSFFFGVFRLFSAVCSPPMLESVCKIIYVWQLCEVPCNPLAKVLWLCVF